MLCGWITTSIRSGARSNSQRASITSSALFIIVAESTEILRPITQFGCAQASSGVTLAQRRRVAAAERAARGGEHDVVDALRASSARSSGRHWKIAECSLSIGSSVAPPSLHRAA